MNASNMSKWSLCKAKCHDNISRPLSWTTLAWISQTYPKPSSGTTLPPPNLTYDMPKWTLYKAKSQDDTSRPLSRTTLAWIGQSCIRQTSSKPSSYALELYFWPFFIFLNSDFLPLTSFLATKNLPSQFFEDLNFKSEWSFSNLLQLLG